MCWPGPAAAPSSWLPGSAWPRPGRGSASRLGPAACWRRHPCRGALTSSRVTVLDTASVTCVTCHVSQRDNTTLSWPLACTPMFVMSCDRSCIQRTPKLHSGYTGTCTQCQRYKIMDHHECFLKICEMQKFEFEFVHFLNAIIYKVQWWAMGSGWDGQLARHL